MTGESAEICAVLAAADPSGLYILTLAGRQKGQGQAQTHALPSAPFDATRGQSFEDRLHDWASVHTTAQIRHILQIGATNRRGRIRIGLLALVSDRNAFMPRGAHWTPIEEIFPWEHWLSGEPSSLSDVLRPALTDWAQGKGANAPRQARDEMLFAASAKYWEPVQCADRFDVLYQAGLLPEALRDRTGAMVSMRRRHAAIYGQIMQGDDRQTLAQALALLRRETGQSSILPALLPTPFTLGVLQNTVEVVIGLPLHTQNFRRDIVRSGMISKTGKRGRVGHSRPGDLWAWDEQGCGSIAVPGMPLPRRII